MPDPSTAEHSERIIAGAMSGTSADGVDVALTRIQGRGTGMTARLLHHHHHPYDAATKNEIFAFRGGDATATLARLAQLGRTISLAYSKAVNDALAYSQLSASQLAAIAAHGQTLYHGPPNTIQWFDPSLVAAEVGCPVVSDFRRADLAAGGQGAPLVPFADYVLFRHPTKNRILLNIGGIANVTWIPAGASIDQVIAFDTGPGNCVIDYVCRNDDPTGPGYDPQGSIGRQSMHLIEPLDRLLSHPFFHSKPPRSTDGPAMIGLFESVGELRAAPFPQRVATATIFAVATIETAIERFIPMPFDELIVSGGGTRNELIMDHLLVWSGRRSRPIDELGLPSEAKEALAFALLAAATLDGEPSNVPSVTGATRPVVLGSITPKP